MTSLFTGTYAPSKGFIFSVHAYAPSEDAQPIADLSVSFDGGNLMVLRFPVDALSELHVQTASALAALHGESSVDGPLLGSGARW